MMNRFVLIFGLCLVIVVAVVSGYKSAAESGKERNALEEIFRERTFAGLGPGYERVSIVVDSRNREYLLFVPETIAKKRDYVPLVIMLHGGSGSAATETEQSRFHELAKDEGFITVYPDAIGGWWNDGRSHIVLGEEHRDIDDVSFICAMIDTLKKEYPIDTNRIFAAGISNGAFMCQKLASMRSDVFAAIAPVIGGMEVSVAQHFAPTNPVSVLMINGEADPFVPYSGGKMGTKKKPRGETIAIDRIVELWVSHNRCNATPVVQDMPNRNRNDDCSGVKYVYADGQNDTEVVLISIVGGGHTWPGAKPYAPSIIIGKTCNDFKATELIWDFFKAHPRAR